MTTLSTFLGNEHTHCDDLFAEAENAVADQNWPAAAVAFQSFFADMQKHFSHEEEVLFPAFEARTGMTGGPTAVMRMEHGQMNDVMAAMQETVAGHDRDRYLGLSETLLMLMRQHNMKEENILYPMAEQALAGEQENLLREMAAA